MKTKMKNLTILIMSIIFFTKINGQYCSSGGPSSTFDSNVESVFISGENNSSINYTGCPAVTGLENQTSSTVELSADSSYTIDIQFGTCGGNYNGVGEAWIDWNQNTVFEPNESIGTWSGTPPSPLSNFSFIVPSIAVNGITNIRVMQNEGGSLPLNPCASFTWGSVVDFTANISGGFTVTCPSPPISQILSSNIGSNSADISWSPGGTENFWNIQWGSSGFNLGSGTNDTTGTPNYTLSSLNSSSAYDFYVQAICSSGDSSLWTGPYTINTLISGPSGINCTSGGNPGFVYSDDLESQAGWTGTFGSGTTAGSWNLKSGPTSSFNTGPNGAHSGNSYFYVETSGFYNTTTSIVSPMVDLSAGADDAELSFWIHAFGAAIGTFNIGVGTTPNGPFSTIFSTSGQIQTANNDPYQNVGVNLSSYLGQTIYLQLEYTTGSTFTGDFAIDLIEVSSCISCPAPSSQSLTANNITFNSADLAWTAGGTETAWNVQYGPSGFPIGNGNIINVTTTQYTVTGLSPASTYDYYVQARCSATDSSSWAGPYSFVTPCATVTAPYSQFFNSGALPLCWSQSVISGDGWRFSGTPGYAAANNGRPAGTYAWIDFSATDVGTVMEVLPVDVSALSSPQVEFDYFCNNTTNPSPPNILFIEANDGNNWILVDSIQTNSIPGWNPYNFSLIGFDVAGVINVRFRGESGGSTQDFYNDILVDNVHIREAPTCPSPLVSNFGVSNLTSSNGELTWLAGGNESFWAIEWGPSGFPQGTGNYDTTNLFFGYPISNLSPTTNYDFYVQAICGAGDSSYWAGPFTFTTPCAAYFPPQLEDFSTGFPPNACWDQAGDGDPGTGPSGIGASTWIQDGFANSGTSGAAKVYLFSTGKKEWILSPQYDFSTGGPFQLEFDFGVFNVNSSSSGTMGSDDRVEILISRDGGTTWNGIANFDNNYVTNPGGNHEIFPLINDSGLVQFAIWASDGIVDDLESIDIMVDNFAINVIPNCPQPLAILGSNITSDSASISWNAGGNETLWNIQWGSAGFVLGNGTIDTTNTTSYILSNLNPSSAYEFYVQSICGVGDSSVWSGPFSFSTNIQGPVGITCTTGGAGIIYSDDLESQGGWTGTFGTGTTAGSWNLKSGSTSSTGTGPNAAHSGNFYFYYETSGTNPSSASIVSPLIDLSTAADDAELSFWLHAYGAEIGTLNLGVGNSPSGPFTTIFTTSGQIQTANADPYQNVGINLSSYLGQQIYLQFDYTSGSSFTGDIAIDLIEVRSCISCPGVDPSFLAVSSVSTDTVNLNWLGSSNHNSWLVYLVPSGSSVSNTTPFFVTNDTVSLPVSPSTTYNFYVSGICISGDTSLLAGPYSFTSAFQCPPNAICFTYNTGDIPTEYGVSAAGQLSTCAGMVEAVIPSGFILDSIHTSYDMTAAGGAWMSEQRSWLYLPSLNIGESNITSGTGGTLAGTESYSRTTNFMSALNASDTIPIELHAGRTWGGTGCGTNYNKVDDQTWMVIAYYGVIPTCPQPNSLNLVSVGSDSATLTWSTFATDSLWNTYLTPNGVSPNNSHLILSNNDTIILSGLNPSSTYDFYVQTICNAGDSSYLTGPLSFSTNCAADSAPYFTDFDSGFPLCWIQETVSDVFDWSLNAGSTTSSGTGPSQDMSSNGSYMYIETSSPRVAGDVAVLYSQSVDISTLLAPELRFFHHMFGPTIADLTIEISNNGGQSYNSIFTKSGNQGNQWNEEVVSIAAYSGIVKFKITGTVGSSFTGDIAIDNFEVREGPQNDVGIILASLPSASTGCEVDSSIVTATIFNFGYLPQTGFNIQYTLNGTPTVETVFDTLQPGDSLLYTFNLPVDLTQDGSYSFDFTTNLPNDDNSANDAFGTTLTYENYYTPIAATVTDDTVCVNSFFPNGDIATLTASGPSGVDFDWFDDMGNFIGTGDTMTTDTISTSTSVFVAYKELAPGNIGATNNTFGGGGYYNFFTEGLLFDVYSDMTIDSVTIYPDDTGTIGIIIQSLLGSTIFNGTFTISAPVNTISGHKVPIGVNIPAGLGYGMYISSISPGNLSLYRNTTNTSYPYDYGNIASITSASDGTTNFYFFFYNWDISTISCYSEMQEAEIYVDNCTNINDKLTTDFKISPNPNNGEFEVNLSYIGENTTIEILDLSGKLIYQSKIDYKNKSININSISRGVYLISLIENGNRKTKKLIIK